MAAHISSAARPASLPDKERTMQTTQSAKTIVIVAYKPKAGKEADLLQLTREHVPLLRAEGLATNHPVTTCQAKDGTVVEVFEWEAGGVERAHSNPAVLKLWERYASACDYVPLTSLSESSTQFASFTPIEL
jgi:hypothetical protein